MDAKMHYYVQRYPKKVVSAMRIRAQIEDWDEDDIKLCIKLNADRNLKKALQEILQFKISKI
jgi:hypothetical protein